MCVYVLRACVAWVWGGVSAVAGWLFVGPSHPTNLPAAVGHVCMQALRSGRLCGRLSAAAGCAAVACVRAFLAVGSSASVHACRLPAARSVGTLQQPCCALGSVLTQWFRQAPARPSCIIRFRFRQVVVGGWWLRHYFVVACVTAPAIVVVEPSRAIGLFFVR
jgi:hypothetical protein